MTKDIEQFNKDRNEALLSLDMDKLNAFYKKYYGKTLMEQSLNIDIVFWGSVHKAITGQTNLPIEFRRKSKQFLDEHGLESDDDGDL